MKKYLKLILIFVILITSGAIIAENPKEEIKLYEGENIVNLSFEFNPLYVKDLVKIYPEIATVTYNNGTSEIGYVNVFGGIGENFIIYANQIYEINTIGEVILNLE